MGRSGQRWGRALLGVVLTALALGALGGCAATPVPEGAVERALYVDLRKIVETRQRTEWLLDSHEAREAAPAVMRSACQVPAQSRAALASWLQVQVTEAGGPARAAFEANGGELGLLDDVLTLERVALLLEHAEVIADQCPFWLTPDPDFIGVQRDAGRFVLLLESNGGGSLIISPDEVGFGGEGGGRLLTAWGTGEGTTLGFGLEVGGRGKVDDGSGGSQALSANVTAAAPLLLRLTDMSRVIDFELAATAASPINTFEPRPGVRVLVAAGLSTTRVGDFMPTVMGMINYELQPAFGGLPTTHIIRVGTRFSISYDP